VQEFAKMHEAYEGIRKMIDHLRSHMEKIKLALAPLPGDRKRKVLKRRAELDEQEDKKMYARQRNIGQYLRIELRRKQQLHDDLVERRTQRRLDR
jgi:hypothetical protein